MSLGCPFCQRIAAGEYEDAGPLTVSFIPLDPVVYGHRLFVSREHIVIAALAPGYVAAAMRAATNWASLWDDDYNLILNQGENASQTIAHMHVHYVPRRQGDGLHLPWTGQHVA